MSPEALSMFADLPAWQGVLDRHQDLFAGMVPGSRIAIVPRSATSLAPGRHLAALAGSRFELPGGRMLAWEVAVGGVRAAYIPCRGFEDAGADLMLLPDDAALEEIRRQLGAEPLSAMKKMIRSGSILFFVMKNKYELQDAGYEDFLDSLGLAFLGACR